MRDTCDEVRIRFWSALLFMIAHIEKRPENHFDHTLRKELMAMLNDWCPSTAEEELVLAREYVNGPGWQAYDQSGQAGLLRGKSA